jgi:hypothetical protein
MEKKKKKKKKKKKTKKREGQDNAWLKQMPNATLQSFANNRHIHKQPRERTKEKRKEKKKKKKKKSHNSKCSFSQHNVRVYKRQHVRQTLSSSLAFFFEPFSSMEISSSRMSGTPSIRT